MRIGIVTVHSAYNYGAMLQAFATQKVLTEMGHQVQFIDFYPIELEKLNSNQKIDFTLKGIVLFLFLKVSIKHRKKFKRFRKFREQLSLSKRYFEKKEIYETPPKFDVYLVGSDQVWNMENGMNTFNFVDFVKDKTSKKISYASSFGTATIPDQHKAKLRELLADFSAISVREADGVEIIEEATGKDAIQVLDPTLLITKDKWEELLPSERTLNYDYILIYALNNTEESARLVEAVKKRYRLPVVGIPMGYKVPDKYKVDQEIKDAGPLEFVSLFKNAKVVCTSSFHGLAFAINFEKTMFVVKHLTRNSRLDSMLRSMSIENRQHFSPEMIEDLGDQDLFMDFSKITPILDRQRIDSKEFLVKNIGSDNDEITRNANDE